jgi:hypothetical protein
MQAPRVDWPVYPRRVDYSTLTKGGIEMGRLSRQDPFSRQQDDHMLWLSPGAAKAASARRPRVRAPVMRPRRPAMALVVPAVDVVARPLCRGWPAMGIVGILIEDQLTALSVDGEAPGLIEDGETEHRRRRFRRDARITSCRTRLPTRTVSMRITFSACTEPSAILTWPGSSSEASPRRSRSLATDFWTEMLVVRGAPPRPASLRSLEHPPLGRLAPRGETDGTGS